MCKVDYNIFECPQAESIALRYGLTISRIRELNFISDSMFISNFSKYPKKASASLNTVKGKIEEMTRNKRHIEIDKQNALEKTFDYIKANFQKTRILRQEALQNALRQCSFYSEIPTKTRGALFKIHRLQLVNIEKMSFSYYKENSKKQSVKLSNNEVSFLVKLFEELLNL